MKEKKSRRNKVSDKNKNEKEETNDNENATSESEEVDDNDLERGEVKDNKTLKTKQRSSGRKGKKFAVELPKEEELEDVENDEDISVKKDVGRKLSSAKSKRSILDEDEINGGKVQNKTQRKSSRRIMQKSMQETADNEDEEGADEEFEKPLKSPKKGSKRKLSLKGSRGKKSKIDDNDKNEEENEDENQDLKERKTDSKKRKGKVRDDKAYDEVKEEDDDESGSEEYEVEKLVDIYFKKNGEREFLVRWKGYTSKDDTWEPENHLNCKELIDAFLEKCEKAKSIPVREMRIHRRKTDHYIVNQEVRGRKLSARFKHKPRKTYFDVE